MKNIVISLKTAVDRRHHIEQEFQKNHVNFEFFDALTPDLAKPYAEKILAKLQDSNLTGGELACMMSHVSIWQKMIDEDIPCEDILSQLNAAKSALHKCGQVVLEGHIKHCVRDGIEHGDVDKTIENFTKAVERFSNLG